MTCSSRQANSSTGPSVPGTVPFLSLCISKYSQCAHLFWKSAHSHVLAFGWAWLMYPQQLQGFPAPCSPEGIPLPWVLTQVEDQRQLCVLFLLVGGDS